MSPEKVRTIKNWVPPRSVKHVQQFLGFANFYRRFIEGFSKVARPLTELMKKDKNAKNAKKNANFVWTDECQQAFDRLKALFTEAPILGHFHPEKPTVVETDASDFALGAVMSQMQPESSRLHPVAYYSRKFKPAEVNHDIHDKEMLAIVAAFKEWEHMCHEPSATCSLEPQSPQLACGSWQPLSCFSANDMIDELFPMLCYFLISLSLPCLPC
jgi:hypothetical protein